MCTETIKDSFIRMVRENFPDLNEQMLWYAFSVSNDYYKCLFSEEVIIELRRHFLNEFISEEVQVKLNIYENCSCCINSDEKLESIKKKFKFIFYLWEKFDCDKDYDVNTFLAKYFVKDKHFNIKPAWISYLRSTGIVKDVAEKVLEAVWDIKETRNINTLIEDAYVEYKRRKEFVKTSKKLRRQKYMTTIR